MNVYNDRKIDESTLAKIATLQRTYGEYKTYPDSITHGWHSVLVTDNNNFCSEAKVFVEKNRISELVIDNYLPLAFKATSSIKRAKNVLMLSKSDNETTIAEAYFIYDLEEPLIADPPIQAGCVCFWTPKNKYLDEKIFIDGRKWTGSLLLFQKNRNVSDRTLAR